MADPLIVTRVPLTAPPPAKVSFTMPPWLASVLGITTLVLGAPAAVALVLTSGGLAVPPLLATIAGIGSALAPLTTAGAFWAAGGSPSDLLRLLSSARASALDSTHRAGDTVAAVVPAPVDPQAKP